MKLLFSFMSFSLVLNTCSLQAFRARKLAESGGTMGYGGMA